jgi:hypothetical protein
MTTTIRLHPALEALPSSVKASPFWAQLLEDENARQNGSGEALNVNGAAFGWARWNLICTRRDLKLFTAHGIKPNRLWRLRDVKAYFGVSGTGERLMDRFSAIVDAVDQHDGVEPQNA